MQMEGNIPFKKGEWNTYYKNIADHLLRGKELVVKPEEARRVIAVIELAGKSAEEGQLIDFPQELY
jgi:predicted dehydrogenase